MKGLWALRPFAKKYWKIVLIALLLMGVSGWLNGRAVYQTRPVFEPLFESLGSDVEGDRRDAMADLVHMSVLLFCYLAAAAIATGASIYMGEWLSQSVLLDLRATVFQHLQFLSMRFFDQRRSGELISRVNNDTLVLQTTLSTNLATLVVAPVSILVMAYFMIVLSPFLTLVVGVLG